MRIRALCVTLSVLLLTACGGGTGGSSATSRPEVAVSFPVVADVVANVAGDRVGVWSIVPPGGDPHTYRASAAQIERMTRSKGLVLVGGHLERFVETGGWRRAARESGITPLTYAEKIETIKIDKVIDHGDHVHDLREGDPHFWLDPHKVIEALPATVDYLTSIDPGGAEAFARNAAAYRAELERLAADYETGLAAIPPAKRKLIVFHDAYTYFARRYSFEVLGYVVKAPGQEPSAADVEELRRLITDAGVRVVFREPQYNARVLELLAAEQRVSVEVLLTDAFTAEADTYLELMRHNLASLVRGLTR